MTTLLGGGLYAWTQDRPAITDAVGNRVYPRRLPQGVEFPAITYRRIAGAPGLTQSGPNGIDEPRIQWDVWAADPDTADAIASALRGELQGYRGSMGDVPVGLVQVVNDVDVDEPEQGFFRRLIDTVIQVREVAA